VSTVLTVDADLLERWVAAAERLGAQGDVRIEGERLLAAYRKPSRRYHDVTHLRTVLDTIDVLDKFARDADLVRVAAWFHDAVHDPTRNDNESASAALASTVLDRLDIEEEVLVHVSRLVRVTATHDPASDDRDAQVLCDADLAILGGTPDDYVTYATAVRIEYAHVSDEDFVVGRSAVLQALLDRPRIYRTPTARLQWEDVARANLSREVAFLAGAGVASPPP